MDDSGDICACIACSALCGLCCAIAAEEDRREREKSATAKQSEVSYLDPVQVHKDTVNKMNPGKVPPETVYSPSCKPPPSRRGKLPSAV